jgi:hypothetical protein
MAGAYDQSVHFRRAILLFALVLGLAALAAAISPSRQAAGPALVPPPAASGAAATGAGRQVTFSAGGKRVRRAREGEHLLVSVSAEAGGIATIPRLGLTAAIAPAAPAQFDLLAPSPGRYDVLVSASDGSAPRRVGTLVTRP